ncbi:cytochrome P450 [Micromonospora chersina]|uniref:cytochrome P450 n=1 Tax=Micromonospora chersina TaxID=47854 RepID=UPI0033F261BC
MTSDIMPASHADRSRTQPPDFPMQRRCPFDPPAEYERLRAQEPVTKVRVPTGQIAWLVTRYEDVRRLLTDPRVSADRWHPNMPLTEDVTPQTRRNIAAFGESLIGLDQPEHGPRRRMLITEFTVRRMQTLRPHIQHTVDGCIDDLLAGPRPADLVDALAVRVPARTLCELLGMPYEDRDLLERSATAQLRRGVSPQERQRNGVELRGYLDKLVSAKEADPTDDLLGRLILRNRETKLYDHELLVGLMMLLVIAGFETTANMIALGVAGLLQQPEKVQAIIDDPAAVGVAVEELLRYFTVVDALPRVAKGDIEVGGVPIREGDGLLLSFLSANWDEDVFSGATRLDLDRDARHHMAFGYGVHQCLGQNLAREELQIVFRTIFTRIPTLRLATSLEELPFKTDSNIYGLDELPVTW